MQPPIARGLIYMGFLLGNIAHSICPSGTDLPVIRSKNELETIEEYIGVTGNFNHVT